MAKDQITRTYPIYQGNKATPGKFVQLLDNGQVSDLPLRKVGLMYNTQREIVTGGQNGAQTYYPKTISLAANKFLYFYTIISGGTYTTYAVVVTIDANENFSSGTPVVIQTASDASAAIQDVVDLGGGKAFLATKTAFIVQADANDVITVGTGVAIDTNPTNLCLEKIDANRVVAAYRQENASGYGAVRVFSITGNTISPGTTNVHFTTGAISTSDVVLLGTDKALLVFWYSSNYYCRVLTFSGTSVAVNTSGGLTKSASGQGTPILNKISTDRVLLTTTTSATGTCANMIFAISGTTVTLAVTNASDYALTFSGNFMYPDAKTLQELDRVLIAWISASGSGNLYCCSLSISSDGNTVALADPQTNLGVNDGYNWTHILLLDPGTSDLQRALVIPAGGFSTMVKHSRRTGKLIGYLQDAAGTVVLKGNVKGLTGLGIGRPYYADSITGLPNLNNGTMVGVALTDSELLITDYVID
ncbi:hypothetical protein [Brevibacillus sp. SAFN-007a]|uniref:hypothetical protein n=1 Tax=Brevibacillus sp. SAFN-007a TaxID=3436862 RepID=UPI003F815D9F